MEQQPDLESRDLSMWQPANLLPAAEQTGTSDPNDDVAPEEDMTRQFTCSKVPTKDDWSRLRPEIEMLYTKHELKEIIEIMRQKHNLRASEKMYKDRRREWGISKNIKSEEMEAIVRKTAQRLQAGKNSHFQLRNTWVTDAKIKRYRRGKKIQSERQAMALRARTPPELICYTPLASPLTTPRELEIPERLVKVVHEHINSSSDSNSWLVGSLGFCISKKGLIRCHPYNFLTAVYNAARLLKGNPKPAWQSLQIAMSLIVKVVSAKEPQTVFTLVNTVLMLFIDYGLPDIAIAVLNQFHNMSTKLMGEMHPLSLTSGFVKELVASQNLEALLLLYQVQIDNLTHRAGELRGDAVKLQSDQILWSSELKGAFDPIEALQALLGSCEDNDSASEQSLPLRMELAWQLQSARRFREALEICESVAKLASDEEGAEFSTWCVCEALRQMSKCHENLGDMASAKQSIRQAINTAGARYDFEDEVVLLLIADYELLLERSNATDEATQVREHHERLIASKHDRILREEEEEWQRFQALEGGENLGSSSD